MTTVEKKAAVKKRHAQAIEDFQKWLDANQDATPARRAKAFDAFIDNSSVKGK